MGPPKRVEFFAKITALCVICLVETSFGLNAEMHCEKCLDAISFIVDQSIKAIFMMCCKSVEVLIVSSLVGFSLLLFFNKYRITSIKRPGRLLNFSIFRGGVYSRGTFNRGGVY